jgi:hypothetical protein
MGGRLPDRTLTRLEADWRGSGASAITVRERRHEAPPQTDRRFMVPPELASSFLPARDGRFRTKRQVGGVIDT